jgi:hypothetical protein
MSSQVTTDTQGDEILLRVITEGTARLDMVDLQIVERAAPLATPSISPQNLFMQYSIRLLVQLESRQSGADGFHEVV